MQSKQFLQTFSIILLFVIGALFVSFFITFPSNNPAPMVSTTTLSSAASISTINTSTTNTVSIITTTSIVVVSTSPITSTIKPVPKPEVVIKPTPVLQPPRPTPTTTTPPVPVPVIIKAKTALPLYVYPVPNEKNWQIAINAANQVDFIIANVNSGPGTEVKTNWTNMINKTVAAGIKVYGYVHTDYSKVKAETVDKEVSEWLKFYPNISGIFFDEVASGADKLSYYKARYAYIKNINSKLQVVINPGTNTDEGYMNASDVNVLFEASYSAWLTKKMPAWSSKYPKERFYAIVYDVPTEDNMKQVVRSAKERNFGKVFVTSADGPSDPLPSYFQSELVELLK